MKRAVRVALLLALAGCGGAHASGASEDRYVTLYRALHPSVVLITMKIPAVDPKRKGGWDDAFGSGVVVASGGWGSRVLTDAHVVADAKDLAVIVGDGPRAPARVIATTGDEQDLALLETPLRDQTPARLGSSAHLEPGMPVGVLGYPIPDAFQDEHLRRTVSLYTGRVASIRNGAIELDLAIVPGESGGPVFDANGGAVIGIAQSRFEDERAIGFATPIDQATAFLKSLPVERSPR